MIPPLDKRGLLPEGIYDATLSEIKNRFAVHHIDKCYLIICVYF